MSKQKTQSILLLANDDSIIYDEELILLYDLNNEI